MARLFALAVLLAGLAVIAVRPPAAIAPTPALSAPAPQQSSCVACHTSRAALEPLVKPFPALPAEGEG